MPFMRLAALPLLLLASLAAMGAAPSPANTRTEPHHAKLHSANRAAAPSGPPHAWLFGIWTGGLFPVLDGMAAQDCRMQPTVVFAKDQVAHATLLGTTMTTLNLESVRATAAGAEFRFAPDTDAAAGFGCEQPDELHVVRIGPDEINFPGCKSFPYPLQRCAS